MTDVQPILQKADFGAIYNEPDPRRYFNTLAQFNYTIAQYGAEVFDELLKPKDPTSEHVPTILDVSCSYGPVSTLLTTDLHIDDLYRHYASPEVLEATSADVMALDTKLLHEHQRPRGPRAYGLDIAEKAVDYAVAVGSLHAGVAENLETDDPSPYLTELMADVDLITTTGGVGYVTEATFRRLLTIAKPTTQVASFCLRTYDYDPIAAVLDERGLITETVTSTFRQRRFIDPDEKQWAIGRVKEHGFDPAGKEDDGYYHAQFFLSRPPEAVAAQPIEKLLAPWL